jgi:hypothetical protein
MESIENLSSSLSSSLSPTLASTDYALNKFGPHQDH